MAMKKKEARRATRRAEATPHEDDAHEHPTPQRHGTDPHGGGGDEKPVKPGPIKPVQRDPALNPALHRRVLEFLNQAVHPEDLVFQRPVIGHAHAGGMHQGNPLHEDNPAAMGEHKKKLMSRSTAKRLLELRDREFPLGFRNIKDLWVGQIFTPDHLKDLFDSLSDAVYGRWDVFPQPIPRRGPGSYDGVVHAAMCHTGKVLFITADETTLLWDPNNVAASTFENPVNQPHTMTFPAPDTVGYSQLCGHHVFLNDGKLLSVGGGGYGPNSLAKYGFKFDPVAKSWSRTSNAMSEAKWYPTANVLNDDQVLITDGTTAGNMDIYDIASDTFAPMTGDTKAFPNRYPGLHILPNSVIVYSRTGWASAGAGGGATADHQTAFFTITGATAGTWTNIAAPPPTPVNRAKGMSVLLYRSTPPYVRIMVLGGADLGTTANTYEILDASVLSPLSNWGPATPFPDGQQRSLCSAVLLPDGKVFVCGGILSVNSPCAMYDPFLDSWAPMAALPSIREYHSVAILLPSGQVMVAGWFNTQIEIYNPPYMFATRPTISGVPSLVHHGQTFTIDSPDAISINRVVLVRPMAVTHQTDSEQRVLDMPVTHDAMDPNKLSMVAPHGGHPHAFAPKGYYMLFAVNSAGVPSMGQFIFLH